jgi:preprotein translocase subunit SecF
MEFFKSTSAIGFMRGRKLAYLVSTVLFVVSIGALVFKGLNLGVDFTGGVTIEAKFTQEAQPEALRRNFEAAGFKEVQVQNFGSSRDVAIRLPPPSGETADAIRARVETVLRAADAEVVISRAEIVGPQVGAELRNSAIVALISTLILIFIYVFLRFHAGRFSQRSTIRSSFLGSLRSQAWCSTCRSWRHCSRSSVIRSTIPWWCSIVSASDSR